MRDIRRKKSIQLLVISLVAVSLVSCVSGATVPGSVAETTIPSTETGQGTAMAPKSQSTSPPSLPSPMPPSASTRLANLESGVIVSAVQAVRPAVVNITNQQLAYDFYLRPIPEEAGTGSGVIFDANGYILTNNHVVAYAQGLKISLPDGRSFDGKLVGSDPRSDLAIVKIDGDNLPIAELGDSDALQIGETVVAIGNALGLPGGPTVTSGIVGALGRTIREPNGALLYDLIQTDAAINPGNSGGPLINLQGQVVGINTAIAAEAPGGGIGFAISINLARPIADQLVRQGRVVRPWLGVTLQTVTPGLAARNNLPVSNGVLITSVQRNAPAARAGLRPGDIIVKFGEEEIKDDVGLYKATSRRRIGETVSIVAVRDSGTIQASVTLEEMP